MIYVLVILTILLAYLFMKDSNELWGLKSCLHDIRKKLPEDMANKLKYVNIHLTDTNIGYCINGKDIGIYKSYGKKYNVSQKDVLIHELAHITSGEVGHTKKFWEHYRMMKSL